MSKVKRLPTSLVAKMPKALPMTPEVTRRLDAKADQETQERMKAAAKMPAFKKIAQRYRQK